MTGKSTDWSCLVCFVSLLSRRQVEIEGSGERVVSSLLKEWDSEEQTLPALISQTEEQPLNQTNRL